MSFQDLGTFAKYIQVNQNQEIELFIYNVDSESVKRSVIEPRDNWGGEGLIGADISFGYCNPGKSKSCPVYSTFSQAC